MKRIAAVTMVRNDGFYLRKWTSWYGAQLGEENLYILLDGRDQAVPDWCPAAHVIVCDRVEGQVRRADKGRIIRISEEAARLFEAGCDLVITGEGRTDWQSCFGKVMQGVGVHARAKGIPAVGLSGSLGRNAMNITEHGIGSLMTTVNAPMPLSEAMERAEELYYEGAVRMFRMIRVGMEMKK